MAGIARNIEQYQLA